MNDRAADRQSDKHMMQRVEDTSVKYVVSHTTESMQLYISSDISQKTVYSSSSTLTHILHVHSLKSILNDARLKKKIELH